MSVGRICCREVYLAGADETVEVAAARMRDQGVGTLLVLDPGRRPVGIVTDRDLVVRVLAAGRGSGTRVAEVMTTPVHTVQEDTPIEDALRVMRERRHRRVAVVDGADQLVGVLALDDVISLLGSELDRIRALVDDRGRAASTAG